VPKVLVIDDEESLLEAVRYALSREGFDVTVARDGGEAVRLFEAERPDLLVLDLMLPVMNGWDVCRRVRASSQVPIIMLTARDAEVDRVVGLEMGADDYVTKPFSPRELVARVKAILRRTEGPPPEAPEVLTVGRVEVDTGRREARVDGGVVALATREFDLLSFLAGHEGLALSRRQLLDNVWGPDWYGDERTVDVHVRQLRKKLGDALPLATVWGVGYRLG